MSCQRCGCNQVGGTQAYPCKEKVDKLKKDILALERCLIDAATPTRPSRPTRPCHCCCCCRCENQTGNQTTWGR